MSDRWNWDEEEEESAPERAPEAAPEVQRPRRTRRRKSQAEAGEGQSNWYLLTGLILGLALGLLIAWVISPVRNTDTAPESLDATYKDEYRRTIALAYQASGNLDRARRRLALLDSEGSVQVLAAQAQRMLAENRPPEEARLLAILAADLGRPPSAPVPTSSLQVAAATSQATALERTAPPDLPTATQPESTASPPGDPAAATQETVAAVQTPTLPQPTRTPTVTVTLRPTLTPLLTATPLPVLDAPFVLTDRKEVCDGTVEPNLLQIFVTGSNDEPLPGVQILVSGQEKQEIFFTGLAADISPGYADFLMEPGVLYSLRVGEISEPLNNLQSNGTCGLQIYYAQEE